MSLSKTILCEPGSSSDSGSFGCDADHGVVLVQTGVELVIPLGGAPASTVLQYSADGLGQRVEF